MALQFDLPDENRGFLQGIRLQACPQETLVVRPEAIRPEASYVFENPESDERREVSGKALLRNGFAMTLSKREGAIWFYSIG